MRAAAEHDIRSSLSVPLFDDNATVGALNLYATSEEAFPDDTAHMAQQFATQASVAPRNAQVYWHARHLADGLSVAIETRDKIGQAKGILMNALHITADDAFERIRTASQRRNIKVVDLADEIIWTGQLSSDASD